MTVLDMIGSARCHFSLLDSKEQGFVYYSDESVVDSNGARFMHAAVLIRPDWLVSSAIDHNDINKDEGFPRKTLLARVGAISIDSKISLNEDEDEQEREVIRIVRPHMHSSSVWWLSDITLLKTLVPFNITASVAAATLNLKKEFSDKNCFILLYMKSLKNTTDDKVLVELSVDLLPPSMENCGTQFTESSMTCGVQTEETKKIVQDSDFCSGNNGGPLICDREVTALQTYFESNCKPPHLYQLLHPWNQLITCATREECDSPGECSDICSVTNKDEPSEQSTELNAELTTDTVLSSVELSTEPTETEVIPTLGDIPLLPSNLSAALDPELTTSPDQDLNTNPTNTESNTDTIALSTTEGLNETGLTSDITPEDTTAAPWPVGRILEGRRDMGDTDGSSTPRTPNIEAHKLEDTLKHLGARSAAVKGLCFVYSLLINTVVLACLA